MLKNRNLRVHFKSESIHWSTPTFLLESLRKEFGEFDDPCPFGVAEESLWGTPGGLTRPWNSPTFLNPPYGTAISRWMKKAVEEFHRGVVVVCLVPSRTDTDWWHEYVMKATEIRLLRGRLKFGGALYNAPFPSAVVVYQP